jgi:hypothetical protein
MVSLRGFEAGKDVRLSMMLASLPGAGLTHVKVRTGTWDRCISPAWAVKGMLEKAVPDVKLTPSRPIESDVAAELSCDMDQIVVRGVWA